MKSLLAYYYNYYINFEVPMIQSIINVIMIYKGDSRCGNIRAKLCCWTLRPLGVNRICTINTCERIFLSSYVTYLVVYLSEYLVVFRIKTKTLAISNVHCSELLKAASENCEHQTSI